MPPPTSGAGTTAALLRAEAGREPHDRALRDLIGDLSTLSPEFRALRAAHDVRVRHYGVKKFRHPEVGPLELTYQSLLLPLSTRISSDRGWVLPPRGGWLPSWRAV
ncbi:hypothetical protein ABZ896_19115 [Streptomyces sp. NPDC047072]|uniref:MmyB family transcriptional regulator n=1 Tax=Streptomyces sp. NPDC047072 TaxID=3154809 RepID=UPI0033E05455